MQFYRKYTLPIISVTLALSACSSSSDTTSTVATPGTENNVVQPIEFQELVESALVPVGEIVEGAQQATGYGNSAGLNYILTNNQRVVVFTDEVEFVESFEIPMLRSVSAQALSAENGVLAVLDSQVAALTYGQDGDWLTVNRSGAKTLYTLEPDGDLGTLALDSRLTDYEIVGADVDGNVFVLSNNFQQQRQTNIFEIDSQGQLIAGWTLPTGDGLVPSALNVNITDDGIYEFVIAHEDSMATVKLTETPGGTEEPEALID